LTLKIGIDGLPISKSSNKQFWPVLCSVDQSENNRPFIVSLFYGDSKPNDINLFLKSFVEELEQLENEGFEYNGKFYNIRIRCIVADAPARSYIKCIKNHNAYYSCERCDRKGKWMRRVVYPGNRIGNLYTDAAFINQEYVHHHEGISPLTKLKLGMISQIPLDYMHLICLGVVKKLLITWTSGPLTARLSPRQILSISRRLISMKCNIPKEFNRKCRSLKDLKHWKATELRTFVLYVGPSALRGILNDKLFSHFLLLHSAVYILCSELAFDKSWVSYAGELLSQFVNEISDNYYKEFYVYNVHSLLHLHSDVSRLGPLDYFSAFEFENSMQYLKKMIRMNNSHLSQVVRRVSENEGQTFLYDMVCESKCKLSCATGDNCFMSKDGKIYVILTLHLSHFECYEFLVKKKFEGYPFDSRKLGIICVSKPSKSVKVCKEDYFKKIILLPFGSDFVCVPVIHS
jgi:hypothetical protein